MKLLLIVALVAWTHNNPEVACVATALLFPIWFVRTNRYRQMVRADKARRL